MFHCKRAYWIDKYHHCSGGLLCFDDIFNRNVYKKNNNVAQAQNLRKTIFFALLCYK